MAAPEASYGSQESPYTNFESNGEYVRAGYGGLPNEASTTSREQQPDYHSPSAAPLAPPNKERKGGIKEKIKGKLAPCLGGHSKKGESEE